MLKIRDFILVRSLNCKRYNNPERLIIGIEDGYIIPDSMIVSVAKVVCYKDFDIENNNLEIVSDTDSVEFVVKTLYKKEDKIFYKIDGKKHYLTEDEIKKLNEFIAMVKQNKILKDYSYNDIKEY